MVWHRYFPLKKKVAAPCIAACMAHLPAACTIAAGDSFD